MSCGDVFPLTELSARVFGGAGGYLAGLSLVGTGIWAERSRNARYECMRYETHEAIIVQTWQAQSLVAELEC